MKFEVWRLVVSLGREGLGAEVERATCSEWRVPASAYRGVREVGVENSEEL
jgi:hypothetical protein